MPESNAKPEGNEQTQPQNDADQLDSEDLESVSGGIIGPDGCIPTWPPKPKDTTLPIDYPIA